MWGHDIDGGIDMRHCPAGSGGIQHLALGAGLPAWCIGN
jgi:hypothetical protein